MESTINVGQFMSALVYTVFGSVAFAIAFKVLDWLAPNDFWTEILEEHNTALAILIGSLSIGLSIIIASAIKG